MFLFLRVTLLGISMAAFFAATFVSQPLEAVLIVFGLVVGSAWIVGLFMSNRMRRQEFRRSNDDDRR
jgi:hypothetical protein